MATKKYPIGTTVIFMAKKDMCSQAQQDDGKVGEVIESDPWGVRIFLLESVKGKGCGYWHTSWENIRPVVKKNQQLLFSFME